MIRLPVASGGKLIRTVSYFVFFGPSSEPAKPVATAGPRGGRGGGRFGWGFGLGCWSSFMALKTLYSRRAATSIVKAKGAGVLIKGEGKRIYSPRLAALRAKVIMRF